MKKFSMLLTIIISVFLLASVVAAKNPHIDRFNDPDRVDWALNKVEKATEKYRDVNKAIADGYQPTDHFVPDMGYHYVNPGLIDDKVDALMPEVMIYVPNGKSGLKLVAVEYLSTEPNHIFGLEFDPPAIPIPLSKHAWIYEKNPDGIFAPFNPRIGPGPEHSATSTTHHH